MRARARMILALTFLFLYLPVIQAQTILPVEVSSTPSSTPAPQAQAQDGIEESTYDRIWRRFTEWYVDDSNPVVQKVLFSGRFQHEFAAIDADEVDHREWNVRRMRLGSRVTLFRTFTLHGEVELNPQEADPLYVRFTDLYVQWSRSRVPHPVSWTHVCATRHGVARIPRALRAACDTPASRGASTGCSVRRTRRRRRAPRRGFERPGRRWLAP